MTRRALARPHPAPSPAATAFPPGLWKVTLGVFLLLIGDLGTAGTLAGQFFIDRAAATPALAGALASPAGSSADLIGPIYGTILAFAYMVYPMQFIAGRCALGLQGLRQLAWFLVVAHPILLATLAVHLRQDTLARAWALLIPGPICLAATAFLPSIVRALRGGMPWLDPAAASSTLPSRLPAPPVVARAPSSRWISVALPFVTAFQAARPGLGILALLFWLGGLFMLFVSPLRAVGPLVLAAGIGIRTRTAPSAAPPHAGGWSAPLVPDDLPDRAPSPTLSSGLLVIPLLTIADALGGLTYTALRGAKTIPDFLTILSSGALLLIVPIVFLLLPAMLLLAKWLTTPDRRSQGTAAHRAVASLLLIAYAGLLFFFATLGFSLDYRGWGITIAEPIRTLLLPAVWALVALTPFATILAFSAFGSERPYISPLQD